jgi:CBS domain-containing protein
MHDITEFLRRHEPFDELDDATLEGIAEWTEVEYFPAGTVIFQQGAAPQEHVRMIRRGSVQLLDGDEVLDELTEGDLFGHPSMLTGLPTEFASRAAEDTLCYRLRSSDLAPLLTRPEGMRYVLREMRHREALLARSPSVVAGRLATRPISRLISTRCIVCQPDTSIREVARQMVEADVSCAVVALEDGHGIVTDRDLRARVIAVDRSRDAPVRDVMSAPALSTDPERPAAEVALMMIERGVRHMPVIDASGHVLGVVRDIDLLAAETRDPFNLRREIRAAAAVADLQAVVRRLPEVLIGLHDAGTAAAQIARVHTAIADATIGRLLELIPADSPRSAIAPSWIALGSHGRRELAPGSDLDSAATWPSYTTPADEAILRVMAEQAVHATRDIPGLSPDPNGETAASTLFARSLESWRAAVRRWAANPSADRVPIVLSALLDGRALGQRTAWNETVLAEMLNPLARRELERWLLGLAVGRRVPTGLLRSRVLDAAGAPRQVDLKRDGLQPIVELARYGGFAAGAGVVSTPGRLKAAAEHGVLRRADAELLAEAYELFTDLRVTHHLSQLQRGVPVTDTLARSELNGLSRSYVKDAFRLIGGIQRRMAEQLRVP